MAIKKSTISYKGKDYTLSFGEMPPDGISEVSLALLYIILVELVENEYSWENLDSDDEIEPIDFTCIIKDPDLGYLSIWVQNDYSNKKGCFTYQVTSITEKSLEHITGNIVVVSA